MYKCDYCDEGRAWECPYKMPGKARCYKGNKPPYKDVYFSDGSGHTREDYFMGSNWGNNGSGSTNIINSSLYEQPNWQYMQPTTSQQVQNWLDKEYPKNVREKLEELNISRENLRGHLNLSDFTNLQKLNCSYNQLTSFQLSDHKEKLKSIDLSNNKFRQEITCFQEIINLENLNIKNNPFYGNLESLRRMNNLSILNIEGTDIDSGLEHLPMGIKKFYCWVDKNSLAKVRKIAEQLKPFGYDLSSWREKNISKPVKLTHEWIAPANQLEQVGSETIELANIQQLEETSNNTVVSCQIQQEQPINSQRSITATNAPFWLVKLFCCGK